MSGLGPWILRHMFSFVEGLSEMAFELLDLVSRLSATIPCGRSRTGVMAFVLTGPEIPPDGPHPQPLETVPWACGRTYP